MQHLIQKIKTLKQKKQAIILAHNYQRPEIFEVADFVGDSLALCRKAQESNAKIIILSGVYFMAESAKILNPCKKVLIPAKDASCALADTITAEILKKKKLEYPDAAVVCYINSTAEVKAESDVICTSSNAVSVVRNLPHRKILFVPDKNLALYVAKQVPEKEIIPFEGFCPIHHRITEEYLEKAKKMHPKAKIIAHPECQTQVLQYADYVSSTGGMIEIAKNDPAEEFIVITECAMQNRMKELMPNKKFYTLCSICFDMKKNTLEGIYNSLMNEEHEVNIDEEVRIKAYQAFQKMFFVTNEEKLNKIKNALQSLSLASR